MKSNRSVNVAVCGLSLLLLLLGSTTSQGALIVTNKTTGTIAWTTGTNWVGGVYPNGNTNGADLRIDATGATTFNLGAAITLNELWLGDMGGAGFLAQTLANGTGGTLTLDNEPGGGTVTITNEVNSSSITNTISTTTSLNSNLVVTTNGSPAGQLALTGVISNGANGAKSLTKSGGASDGKLTLSGLNTFSGGVTLTNGWLYIKNNGTSASGPLGLGTFTINGGTLDVDTGRTIVNPQQWNGSFTYNGTSTLTCNTGTVTLGGDPTVTVNASTLTVAGPMVDGGHSLTKAGNGTLTLSGSRSGNGGLTLTAGPMTISGDNTAGAAGAYTGTVTVNGGTLTLSNAKGLGNGFLAWNGPTTTLSTGQYGFGGITVSSGALTLSGNNGGAGYMTVNGGTLALTADNTTNTNGVYTGAITLNSGATLKLGNAKALGAGSLTINGGTLDASSSVTTTSTSPITLAGDFAFTGTNALNFGAGAPVTLSADPTITTNSTTNNLTFSGVIGETGGSHGFTKGGNSGLVLGGSNTFSGGLTINTGKVTISNTAALGTGTLTLNGGTIDSNVASLAPANAQAWNGDFTYTATQDIAFGGNVTMGASRTVTVTTSGKTVTLNGVVSDGGNNYKLTKAGAGAMKLMGANTYGGGTLLSAGSLTIGNASALGTGTDLEIAGGTLHSTSTASATPMVVTSVLNQTWSGDFIIGGNYTSFPNSTVTLAGATRTANISYQGGLTIGGGVTDGGNNYGLNKISSGFLTINGNSTLGGPISISAGTMSFNGANNSLTGAKTVTGGQLNIAGTNTFAGDIAVSAGTLIVSGANTGYTGALTLSGTGTVWLNNAQALGDGQITINGGTLGGTASWAGNISQTWNSNVTIGGGSNLNTGPGAITLTGNRTLSHSNGATLTIGGPIGDGGSGYGLTRQGGNYTYLTLAGNNTYTGQTWAAQDTTTLTGSLATSKILIGGGPANASFNGGTNATIHFTPGDVITATNQPSGKVGTLALGGGFTFDLSGLNGGVPAAGIVLADWSTGGALTGNISTLKCTAGWCLKIDTTAKQLLTDDPTVKPALQVTGGVPGDWYGNAGKQYTVTVKGTGGAWPYTNWRVGTILWQNVEGQNFNPSLPSSPLVVPVTVTPGAYPSLSTTLTFSLPYGGSYCIPVAVTSGAGVDSDDTPIYINDMVGCDKPSPLPDATAGALYPTILTAINGHWPYTYTAVDPSTLPPGLTLTSQVVPDPTGIGVFTGRPTTPGTYTFTVKMTELSPFTTYTTYTMTVVEGAPSLDTAAITNLTSTSATTGGTVYSDGGEPISARGIVYGTAANPDILTGTVITDPATDVGTFVTDLTGLTPGTTYHVRSFATNSLGTGYGADVMFVASDLPTVTTAEVSAITQTTATAGGEVTADGFDASTARGVCFGTAADPDILTGTVVNDTGTGVGAFTVSLTGLTATTTYHVRAFATNGGGTVYGTDVTFTTADLAVPTVTTTAVTNITDTSADTGGEVTADGGSMVTVRGVCYATTADPDILTGTVITDAGTGLGAFASSLTGLTTGTTYHVRAYATNSLGTAYGADVSFVASSAPVNQAPVVNAGPDQAITLPAGAAMNGTATDDGLPTPPAALTITWSQVTGPGTASFADAGSLTTTVSFSVDGTYVLQLSAFDGELTTTDTVTITVNPAVVELPAVTTAAVSNVGPTSADCGGSVTSEGSSAVTARGVCWSTTADPTKADSLTSDGSGSGEFVSSITGLTPGTVYHVRAYATSLAGTAYGSDVSFTTFYLGDVDRDGSVNLADLKLLVAAWNSNPSSGNWNPNADIDTDGQVNLADLKILVANWNKNL